MSFRQAVGAMHGSAAWLGIIDVIVVSYLIYRLLLLVRGTRALQIMGGLATLLIALVLSDRFHLDTLHWLLKQVVPLGPVAIVILFYPELRHALEEFGPRFWSRGLTLLPREDMNEVIETVITAVMSLSANRVGALIVFERQSGLDEQINSGVVLDSAPSVELLETIFYKGTALHDGAVIIRHSRIAAAGCMLPLTDRPKVDPNVHTRHRAALGMSDQSDAVIVVVSEETGTISIALDGNLVRGQGAKELREQLTTLLSPPETSVTRLRDTVRERVRPS
jgi:diadenylate cyclase